MTRRFDIEIDGSRLGHVMAKSAMGAAKRFVAGPWSGGGGGVLRYECPVGRDGYEYALGETRFVVRLRLTAAEAYFARLDAYDRKRGAR